MINLFFDIIDYPRSIFVLNLSRTLRCMNVSNEQKFRFKIFPECIWVIIIYPILHNIAKLCKKRIFVIMFKLARADNLYYSLYMAAQKLPTTYSKFAHKLNKLLFKAVFRQQMYIYKTNERKK